MNVTKTNYDELLVIRKNKSTNEIEIIFNDLYGRDFLDVYHLLPELEKEMKKQIY